MHLLHIIKGLVDFLIKKKNYGLYDINLTFLMQLEMFFSLKRNEKQEKNITIRPEARFFTYRLGFSKNYLTDFVEILE